MRRILLDQGLSPTAAALLRANGWDALHVMEAGLDRAEDIEILEFARRESRSCVTLDHDFHTHMALTQMAGPSVILVRLEGLNALDQAALIRKVWAACGDDITAGAAVSVDAVSMQCRCGSENYPYVRTECMCNHRTMGHPLYDKAGLST